MTIIVAPKSALAPTRPSVGIFWRVNGVLVIDRSTLDEAEPYGECITHTAGHYERSQEWDASGLTLTFLSCSRDVDDNSCSHNDSLDCFGRFGNRPNESDH